MPADVNTFCYVVDKLAFLDEVPVRQIEIPPGGMIIGNGSMAAHEVVFGDRMVCLEAYVRSADASQPLLSEQETFEEIVRDEGISVAAEYPGLEDLANLEGSLDRVTRTKGDPGSEDPWGLPLGTHP